MHVRRVFFVCVMLPELCVGVRLGLVFFEHTQRRHFIINGNNGAIGEVYSDSNDRGDLDTAFFNYIAKKKFERVYIIFRILERVIWGKPFSAKLRNYRIGIEKNALAVGKRAVIYTCDNRPRRKSAEIKPD